jgi:hypothetical protein
MASQWAHMSVNKLLNTIGNINFEKSIDERIYLKYMKTIQGGVVDGYFRGVSSNY